MIRSKTKCVKKFFASLKFNSFDKSKYKDSNFQCIINDSSLLKQEKEFFQNKKEISSYYRSNINRPKSKKTEGLFDLLNDKCFKENKLFSDFLIENNCIIWEGYFGKVFCAYNKNNKLLYSIKQNKNKSRSIQNEISLLKYLIGVEGVPQLYDSNEANNNNIIIQSLFCPSLDKFHWYCNNAFSEMTCLLI